MTHCEKYLNSANFHASKTVQKQNKLPINLPKVVKDKKSNSSYYNIIQKIIPRQKIDSRAMKKYDELELVAAISSGKLIT